MTHRFLQFLIFSVSINSLLGTRIGTNELSQVDWTNYNHQKDLESGSYAFGYDIQDSQTNNVQFRNEERHPNGSVTGSYGYLLPDGNVQIVTYVADALGYRAFTEIHPRGQPKSPNSRPRQNRLVDTSKRNPLSDLLTKDVRSSGDSHNTVTYNSRDVYGNIFKGLPQERVPTPANPFRVMYYPVMVKIPIPYNRY